MTEIQFNLKKNTWTSRSLVFVREVFVLSTLFDHLCWSFVCLFERKRIVTLDEQLGGVTLPESKNKWSSKWLSEWINMPLNAPKITFRINVEEEEKEKKRYFCFNLLLHVKTCVFYSSLFSFLKLFYLPVHLAIKTWLKM